MSEAVTCPFCNQKMNTVSTAPTPDGYDYECPGPKQTCVMFGVRLTPEQLARIAQFGVDMLREGREYGST